MRVKAENIENFNEYEYLVGRDANGKGIFEKGYDAMMKEYACIEAPAGGVGVMYNEYLGEWVIAYCTPGQGSDLPYDNAHEVNGIYMRVAKTLDGEWSNPVVVMSQATYGPVYEPRMLQINKLRQKVECGAEYIQTQGIFDLDSFKRFMEEVDKAGIKTHIMAGIIPLKAAGMAKFMNANVPGIDVPQHMIDRLAAAAAEGKEKGIKGLPAKVGMEMAAEMIAKIKDEKLCDGVHVMAIGAEKNVPTILDLAGITV